MTGLGFPVNSQKFDANDFHVSTKTTSISNQFVSLLSLAIPVGETRLVTFFLTSSRIVGMARVKIDSDVYFVARNSPSQADIKIPLVPRIQVDEGKTLTVEFCAGSRPFVGDVDLYVSGFKKS